MSRAASLAANLAAVRDRVARAEARAGRAAGSVKLVAVSKKMPAADVVAMLAAGQTAFGENYAQELRDKRLDVESLRLAAAVTASPAWHFIGPLQTNKAKYVAGLAACLHSLDTSDLLDEVNRRVPEGQVQSCLVQVNVAHEPQKRGVLPGALPGLLAHFAHCPRLRCDGFMLIPPASDDAETARPHFRALRTLLEREASVPRPGVQLRELSMGMSHDLDVAIEEGATFVRVGTALFGPRTSI